MTDIRTTDIRRSKTLGVRTLLHSGFVSQETVQTAMAAPAFSYLDDLQISMRSCHDWQSTDECLTPSMLVAMRSSREKCCTPLR